MPSGVPSIRYMGLIFHAMQPIAAGVRTAGPSRLRLVRNRRRAAINGRALVIASTIIYSGITGERGATMFRVYLTVYEIIQNSVGCIIDVNANDVIIGLQTYDPTEVVRLFHRMPDNSEMLVYDEWHGYEYRFSKGELLKSEKDTDIDLFSWSYA